RFIEFVGQYDPMTDPHTLKLKEERILEWLGMGASYSDTVGSLLRQSGLLARWHEMKTGQKVEKKAEPKAVKKTAEPGKVEKKKEAAAEVAKKEEAPKDTPEAAETGKGAVAKGKAKKEAAAKVAKKEDAPKDTPEAAETGKGAVKKEKAKKEAGAEAVAENAPPEAGDKKEPA
ncbi:MAG: 30S ribosomal protein S16, partial [Gemmatimonadota bacterium]|nr:30S ribosomal protein S16 [Gemmatimonadota bacterium]